MKLEKVLNQLNSLEKNSFLKVVDNILSQNPKNKKAINKILEGEEQLKNTDSANLSKIFSLISMEFKNHIDMEFSNTSSQLDILIDILIRDGNCIMSREWLATLYANQVKTLKKKIKEFEKTLKSESSDIEGSRMRDYKVYKRCVEAAFINDEANNLEPKITSDEQLILRELGFGLGLSQEEVRLLNYSVLPLKQLDISEIVNDLKSLGVIFYQKKQHQIFVPDEIVSILRAYRGKEVADKHFRRVMSYLKDSQINLVARKHNINNKLNRLDKINEIINQGISFADTLTSEIFRDGTSLTEVKNTLNDLMFKKLKLNLDNKGKTAEEKAQLIVDHFNDLDKDQKLGISYHGYEKLLMDIKACLPKVNNQVREEYQIQDEDVLKSDLLLDYNIKPRDILYLIPEKELKKFCQDHDVKTRGDEVLNILNSYKDTDSMLLENYDLIARRDYNGLKDNGIELKDVDLGLKFEELTKNIFSRLGFKVDEELKRELNTKKDKMDLVINLGEGEIIIVECKTFKDKGFNKYSTVSRQIKSYIQLAEKSGYRVIKSLLVAPEFSDEFEKECGLEYELNLSLITSNSLKIILDGFISSKHDTFPYKLLLRDVLIKEDRILKAISK